MNFKTVQYFLAICEEESFTRAAIRCSVSQPSLSMAIKRLELNLGGSLFHRTPQVRLTKLGQTVRPSFQTIEKYWDRILSARVPDPGRSGQRSARKGLRVEGMMSPSV